MLIHQFIEVVANFNLKLTHLLTRNVTFTLHSEVLERYFHGKRKKNSLINIRPDFNLQHKLLINFLYLCIYQSKLNKKPFIYRQTTLTFLCIERSFVLPSSYWHRCSVGRKRIPNESNYITIYI